ncbi:hypothetical protein [Streptomyces sp. MK37H]|uniref:hypothetical protein n=1 Tax=Streptomyces sp. MK37H TaxID=2699117 RepID=UPI001FF8932E|nr:hypothetical protein [Streptomyces sp. MK37H]
MSLSTMYQRSSPSVGWSALISRLVSYCTRAAFIPAIPCGSAASSNSGSSAG